MIARSQNTLPLINDGTCDSILDKKKWDNDFAMYSKTSGTYAEFDTHGNLTVLDITITKRKMQGGIISQILFVILFVCIETIKKQESLIILKMVKSP